MFFENEITWHETCGFEHVTSAPCPPHEPIRQQADPETGAKAYPWFSRNGREVSATGWVYGCDCATCQRRQIRDGAKYLG